jgi:hypothetical protein
MSMRRSIVIVLCALAAAPAALAATRAAGDGVLELRDVYGTVSIGKDIQPARGVLWGQMDRGKLTVVDPVQNDGQIFVSGYEKRTVVSTADTGGPTVVVYSGSNLHFRVTGGKYRLWFRGTGVDLTAVGVGSATMTADVFAYDPGDYSLDNSDKWTPLPYITRTVRFGVQPVPTTTP